MSCASFGEVAGWKTPFRRPLLMFLEKNSKISCDFLIHCMKQENEPFDAILNLWIDLLSHEKALSNLYLSLGL